MTELPSKRVGDKGNEDNDGSLLEAVIRTIWLRWFSIREPKPIRYLTAFFSKNTLPILWARSSIVGLQWHKWHLKQLNNLIYDLSWHFHWLSYLPAVSLISPDDTARITYLQEWRTCCSSKPRTSLLRVTENANFTRIDHELIGSRIPVNPSWLILTLKLSGAISKHVALIANRNSKVSKSRA